jgi:hypothetical protein
MSAKQLFAGIGTAAVFATAIVGATFLASPNLSADDEHSANDKGRIEVGLQVAPVHSPTTNTTGTWLDSAATWSTLISGATVVTAPGRRPMRGRA